VGTIRDPSDTRSSGITLFAPVFIPSEIEHGGTVGTCISEPRLPSPSGHHPPHPPSDTQDVASGTGGTVLGSNTPVLAPASPVEFIKKVAGTRTKAKKPRTFATSSIATAVPIGFPPHNPLDARSNELGTSRVLDWGTAEYTWRTSYEAAKAAVEIVNESSDMFLPLKAAVEALAVFIKDYEVVYSNPSFY
jgi:hypothetical protein